MRTFYFPISIIFITVILIKSDKYLSTGAERSLTRESIVLLVQLRGQWASIQVHKGVYNEGIMWPVPW